MLIVHPLFFLFVLFLMGCTSHKKNPLEESYAKQFRKEYTAFQGSILQTEFKKNFDVLCHLAKITHTTDLVPPTDSVPLIPTLCFILPHRDEEAGEGKMKLFSHYTNNCKEINAVIISSTFYEPNNRPIEGEFELYGLKEAYSSTLDDSIYFAESEYSRFCEGRIRMAQINNCSYVLVLKKTDASSGSGDSFSNGTKNVMFGGELNGLLYVYTLENQTLLTVLPISAANSENLTLSESDNKQKMLQEDLKNNFNQAVLNTIQSNFKIKGLIPGFNFELR